MKAAVDRWEVRQCPTISDEIYMGERDRVSYRKEPGYEIRIDMRADEAGMLRILEMLKTITGGKWEAPTPTTAPVLVEPKPKLPR